MNLKQAQYLEAVCRTGSITAAAAELYVSRTVISHSLRELEEEFNADLFTRTRTGIRLTEAGEIIREYCRELKASYGITRDKIDALSFREPKVYLKMAVTATTGVRLFPEFFAGLARECPDIVCMIDEMSAYDTVESLRDGIVDFAVTPIPIRSEECPDIGKIFLHRLESVVCVGKDDPLSGETYLTREQIESRWFATLASPNPLKFPLKILMRVNQPDLIHKAVASGFAIALLPADDAREWDDVVCIPFKEPLISDVHLAWNQNIPHSDAFFRFLDYVKRWDKTVLEKA